MDALEALFRPLAILINRQIAVTTPAREICSEIEGSVVGVRVKDSALAIYFHVHADSIALTGQFDQDPDVLISGSLLSLGKLATPDAADAIRDGSVELHGDARVAQSFQRLLLYGKPDLEEELSALIGDSAARNVGEMAKRLLSWGSDVRTTMGQNFSEYLQEESGAVPTRHEVDQFRDDLNVLRDDVARFEARIAQAEALHAKPAAADS